MVVTDVSEQQIGPYQDGLICSETSVTTLPNIPKQWRAHIASCRIYNYDVEKRLNLAVNWVSRCRPIREQTGSKLDFKTGCPNKDISLLSSFAFIHTVA
jgi:hypothetical protein